MILRATRLSATGNNGRVQESLIRSIAVIGSSSVEQNQNAFSTTNKAFANVGIHVWMCAYLRQRMMLAYNAAKNSYEFGLFGASNAAQLTDSRLTPAAISSQPDAALLYASMNDLAASFTPAQMLASTQSIYDALIAGGVKTVIIQAPGPRNAAASGGAGYFAKQQSLIALLTSWTASAGIPFVDVNSSIQDPITGDWLTGFSDDGVHANVIGARFAGFALANWMRTNIRLGPEPLNQERISNLKGPNPFNTGGTSTLAANWVNFPNSRSTPFLQNATDGGSRWQGVNFHTPDASFSYNQMDANNIPLATAGLAAGQLVRSWCELSTQSGSALQLSAQFSTNGTGLSASAGIGPSGTPAGSRTISCPTQVEPLIFAGPVFQIPNDATVCSYSQWINQNIIGSPSVRMFRYAGAEVVNSYAPPAIGS